MSFSTFGATPAELAQADKSAITTAARTPESRFAAGQQCLKQPDIACAQVALAGINPASPYAKILEAQIAAAQRDHDSVFRLLIPLQNVRDLAPAAMVALHMTLAQGYEMQDIPLRAIQHLAFAEPWLKTQDEIAANQQHIWQLLSHSNRESLLEMRGESPNSQVQGWIDLALAMQGEIDAVTAAAQWRMAYPDHPARENRMAPTPNAAAQATLPAPAADKRVAVLLPIESPVYGRFAEAVLAGLNAARGDTKIQVYPTSGTRENLLSTYQQAVEQGASRVIGPLTREAVSVLGAQTELPVTTLALNVIDQPAGFPPQLFMFGLPVEDEAVQIARLARAQGMQSAIIVAADNALGKRMAQSFSQSWLQQQGTIAYQISFNDPANFEELKANLTGHPADMIFLAANAEQAQGVRPFLDPAIPTFGLSHIYDGNPHNLLNLPLTAVQFVDMPWLIDTDNLEYARYRQAAEAFTPGAEQRWFAVGVDAWRILSALSDGSRATIRINGLSGTLVLNGQVFERQLSLAQFGHDGIRLVRAP